MLHCVTKQSLVLVTMADEQSLIVDVEHETYRFYCKRGALAGGSSSVVIDISIVFVYK